MKNCWSCKNMYMNSGSPGYSDYTPSWPMSLACVKSHWTFDTHRTTETEARKMFEQAETCNDYKFYKDEE